MTMSSLRARFASLDRLPMPELWPDIEDRAAALGSAGRLTSVTPRTSEQRSGAGVRRVALLAAFAVLVTVFGAAIAVGSGIVRVPAIVPVPAESPSPSSAPSTADPSVPAPTASAVAAPKGLVAYGWDGGVWVVNTDGTNAHALLPVGAERVSPLAWSADGSRLLYQTGLRLGVIDAAGSEPRELEPRCPIGAGRDPVRTTCRVDYDGFAPSPDGTRVAYPVWDDGGNGAGAQGSALVVMDIDTGRATRLASTESPAPCEMINSPSWSPDGTRLAFGAARGPGGEGGCQLALLTVGADGSDLRQIVAPSRVLGQLQPHWSSDGSRILLDGFVTRLDGEGRNYETDIYMVDSDGTDFRALTADGVSSMGSWTRDGRVAFVRWLATTSTSRGNPWVMAADGGNATKLETTVPALTAAGCLICYSTLDNAALREAAPLKRYETTTMFWQPEPVEQR
jgi:dipeptidyl aminopeptidase/acylaminoacyl peptidase